jgi:hypothetical protein
MRGSDFNNAPIMAPSGWVLAIVLVVVALSAAWTVGYLEGAKDWKFRGCTAQVSRAALALTSEEGA